jgi:hypothetical protein
MGALRGDVGWGFANAVMWLGVLAPCVETPIRLSFCLLGSAGRVYYTVDPLDKHIDSRAFTAMVGARIGYGWQPTERLTVRPFIDGMLPLLDGPLEIKQRGVVVSKGVALGPLLSLGIMLAFDAF